MTTIPATRNRSINGVTLVEVLISLTILLVAFLGLIQASLLSIDHNVRNELRDEAVRIASEYMGKTKAWPFALVTQTAPNWSTFIGDIRSPADVTSRFKNFAQQYRVLRRVRDLDPGPTLSNKMIEIQVTWSYRGETFTHTIMSDMRNR